MEFIDFLKYGAIGISLALAILSYRLLSKEQDQQGVRKPMLNSIKTYLYLAVFLSVFFGITELVGTFFSGNEINGEEVIDDIWKSHLVSYPDSTLEQKISRINSMIHAAEGIDESVESCTEILKELSECQSKLKDFDHGFYQNLIKLKNAVRDDPDGWINIDYQIDSKPEVVDALKGVFKSMGNNYDNLSNAEIVSKWKSLKSTWTDVKLEYIFLSDISGIVREFLKFSS